MNKRYASVHIETLGEVSSLNYFIHNRREVWVPYLLPENFRQNNEYMGDGSIENLKKIYNQAMTQIYQNEGYDGYNILPPVGERGKRPSFENNIKEFILNTDCHVTMDDLIKFCLQVHLEFGYFGAEICHHKDEGNLIRKNDGKVLFPEIDYLVDKDGITWELENGSYSILRGGIIKKIKGKKTGKKFFEKYSKDDFLPRYNYHAHIVFCCVRDRRIDLSWRRNGYSMSKKNLSRLQKIASETLNMPLATARRPAKRLNSTQWKALKYKEQQLIIGL